MRKLKFFLTCLLMVSISLVSAQTKTASGRVISSEDGQPVIGAGVYVKGSNQGASTDMNGQYSISVPVSTQTLVVSYVGMKTVEVSAGQNVTVTLDPADSELSEIVVTAMNMRRERKALGYAVQDVKGEDLVKAGSSSIATSLQGKLSGVEIKPSSGMPGASAQIVIRGARSFSGNNTPLYVVDGMPIASVSDYSTGNSVTGTDFSNRAIDIDPNEIESINILKGQAAAALYGIRASNGVVIITTKNGKNAKGKPVISVTTSLSTDRISRTPEYQTTWAQGTPVAAGGYSFNPNSSTAWGPKIVDLPKDPTYGGETTNTYTTADGAKSGMYYVPQRKTGGLDPWVSPQTFDNVGAFFKAGTTLNTSLNISQSTDRTNYSFGLGNTTQKGIIPGTQMDRITAKAVAETQLAKNWKTGFSANYSQNYILKAPGANDGLVATVFAAPTNYDLAGIPFASPTDPYQQILYRATNFNNPFWAVENNKFDEKTNRFFGNAFLEYIPQISVGQLVLRYQLGSDAYSTHMQDIHEYKSKNTDGSIVNRGVTTNIVNSLLTATYDINLTDDLKMNVVVGNEINHENNKFYSQSGQNFNFGGWAHISNAKIKDASESKFQDRTVGAFGNLLLSYKDMLYLNLTGRRDVVSSMPRGNRSFFYPSASLGFVLTELDALKQNDILSFAKLRASYAEVGQAGRYYDNYYTIPGYSGGFWTGSPIVYPIDGVTSYIPYSVQFDPNLKPQNTISYEIGADLRFFDSRLGIDYTFSRQNVKDQIFAVPLAGSTGASDRLMNGGAIHTNAHELILTANPIRQKDFDWNLSVNFTKMDNYVDELADGVESIFLGGFVTPQVRAGKGDKFPVIYGTQFARDDQGRILVDDEEFVNGRKNPYYGLPMPGEPGVIGKVAPDFLLGGSTTFRYKAATLSATFDWKKGGQMYHGTNGLLSYTYGLAKSTEDRTTPFTYPGFKSDGKANDIVRGGESDHTAYYYYYANTLGNIDEAFVFNNSFVKLRELSLSYRLPKLDIFNITVSAFARNLLLWTNLPNFDPEASQGNNNMGGAFERFTTPQATSMGMGLNIVF